MNPPAARKEKIMKNITPETQLILSTAGDARAMLSVEAPQYKTEMLELSGKVKQVTTAAELQNAVHAVREIKRLINSVEAARKTVKDPVIKLGQRIDEIAKNYCLELENEIVRINGDGRTAKGLVGIYAEAEQKRIDAENERIRLETEAAQKKALDAIAEQERIAGLQRPSASKEVAAEAAVQTALAGVAAAASQVARPVAAAAGLTAKMETLHEITDAKALYAVRPEWFELVPKKAVMGANLISPVSFQDLKLTKRSVSNMIYFFSAKITVFICFM